GRSAPGPPGAGGTSAGRSTSRPRRQRDRRRPGRGSPRAVGSGARTSCRRELQDVADTPHRVDQVGLPRVDLLAQVADVRLDDVRLAAEVVVPDMVEDLLL